MKKNYFTLKHLTFLLALTLLYSLKTRAQSVTTLTYSYTGSAQTFVVPSCVTSVTIDARGGSGGDGGKFASSSGFGGTGGNGGRVQAVINVTSGETLHIFVGGVGTAANNTTGGPGGYNGGGLGPGSTGSGGGGGGGGASDVRQGGNALGNRVVVASGGGGGGGSGSASSLGGNGGHGGGTAGLNGDNGNSGYGAGGGGGTQTAGGAMGGSAVGTTPGALGLGGDGSGVLSNGAGGGGGGGYYGGGGGGTDPCSGCTTSSAGGGGGSSYASLGATSVVHTQGFQTGNGVIIISYSLNGASLSASASSAAICSGASATLSAANAVSYTWTPGGANASSITVSPTSNTTYTVEGTNSLGCISFAILTLTVNTSVPTLTVVNTASASAGICPNQTVNLSASGALTYTWAGGSQAVTNGVTFSPTVAAIYTVTGGNGCGTATAVTSVSVHPMPVITPVASSNTLCSGSSLTLTAQGNAATYTWTGGSVPFTNGVGFVPLTSTIFTLSGTSVLSCTATTTMPVTVYITPTLAPTASPAFVCIGGSTTLTALGALNYTWSSAGQTVHTNTFVVSPQAPGISTYTVIKSNSNCTDIRTISVITHSLPTVAAIVMPATVCALSPATLAAGGAQTYTWTAPGTPNYTFTGASNIIATPVPATYSVAASDGTCINTATVHLATNPTPTITVSVSAASVCSGQQVTLSASGGNNYTWTAGTSTFYTQSLSHTPTVATAYQVTGDNSFGCTGQASQVVLVNSTPTLAAGPDKNLICDGGSVTFSVTGMTSYTWSTGSAQVTGSLVVLNPGSQVSGPVIYTVTGEDPIGCRATRTVQVNVYVPVLSISGTTNTCRGSTVQLTAAGANSGSYLWNTGLGASSSGPSLTASLTAPAIFTVSASSTSLAITCPVSQTVGIDLYPDPVIQATPQRTTICAREPVELYASGGVSYTWNNGASGATITVFPLIQTNYTVTGTDSNGCNGTGTVQVRVSPCLGISERDASADPVLIYPNPNNGAFTVQAKKAIDLILLNELGQVVKTLALSGLNAYTLSVEELSAGIYILSWQEEDIRMNTKIVVTK